MDDFFNDEPLKHPLDAIFEEHRARISAPHGFEECFVVQVGPYLVWKRRVELQQYDQLVFFDGDCRDVLTPEDLKPKVSPWP